MSELRMNTMSYWLAQRYGFMMIISSIFAIVAIIYLLFNYQHKSQLKQIRSQGIELVRLISEMP